MKFNIITTVNTTEVDLIPYPSGRATVTTGKSWEIYSLILTNKATSSNTLTLKIYKGDSVEASFDIIIPASTTLSLISSNDKPILIVPSDRKLRAVASATSVDVLISCIEV
jgi:hypothetical protein